jgi:hypothetical protein
MGRKILIAPTGTCEKCNGPVQNTQRSDRKGYRKVRFCDDCRVIAGHEILRSVRRAKGLLTWDVVSLMTRKELLDHYKGDLYRCKVKITSHAQIMWQQSKRPSTCQICGFEHIEICHIKDVKDFSMTSTVGEINASSNLIGLCPNHHWLFDHRNLDISEYRGT